MGPMQNVSYSRFKENIPSPTAGHKKENAKRRRRRVHKKKTKTTGTVNVTHTHVHERTSAAHDDHRNTRAPFHEKPKPHDGHQMNEIEWRRRIDGMMNFDR